MGRRLASVLAPPIVLFTVFVGSVFSDTGFAQISYQASFSEIDVVIRQEGGFDLVNLKGCVRSQHRGHPDLPVKYVHLILPSDSRTVEVSIADFQSVRLEGNFLICPGQPDVRTDGSDPKGWVKPDPQVYHCDLLYPAQLVEIVEEGHLAGNHLITLRLCPFQYQPQSGELFFYSRLNVRVELAPAEKMSPSAQAPRRSARTQRLHEKILDQLVENREDVPGFACRGFLPVLSEASYVSSPYYEYLIITSSELESSFSPLVDWKTKKGVEAGIVCLDSILTSYSGRDDAEKIRNFLIEAYQNGTTWVLLGGDEDVVPIRYAYPTNTSSVPSNTNQQICDLYFSDVDGEWDLDNDGVWGEPQHDHPDIYPDLFVGRVPASDAGEAEAFVEKVLCYEKDPGGGASDYLTNMLWISSDQMRDWDGGIGQHGLLAPSVPSNFYQDLTTLIESPSGDSENPAGPEGETCVETMNQGWGLIGVLAHGKSSGFVAKSNLTNGSPKSWVLTFPGEDDEDGHLPNLTNADKYGIMYSISCSQSAIDVDKYPYLGGEPSVGEYYPLAPGKGGVAYLGYSRWGWVSVSQKLFQKFLEYLFDDGLGYHLGVAEALSRCAYPGYRDIDYGHNLFGDPEMQVWTEMPSDLAAIHPEQVTMGERTIHLTASSQGTGVGGAQVCMTLRGRTMFEGETDQDGQISCDVNLDDVGEMSLVVTKSDFVPYEDSITITLTSDVDEDEADEAGIPSFELSQNHPNPFNPATTIHYSVAGVRTPAHTTLKIYNILGQKVRTLVDEPKRRGSYRTVWDGKDDAANDVSSGIYFYTLEVGNLRETKKMTLMK